MDEKGKIPLWSPTRAQKKIRYGCGSYGCKHLPIDLMSSPSKTKTDSDYCRYLALLNDGLPSNEEVIYVLFLVVKTASGNTRSVLGKKKKEEEAEVSSPPLEMTRSGHVYHIHGTGKGGVNGK